MDYCGRGKIVRQDFFRAAAFLLRNFSFSTATKTTVESARTARSSERVRGWVLETGFDE